MYKHTNVQTYKYTNIQIANMQMCKCTNIQMYKNTNVQTYKCTNIQIHNYTNHKHTNVQMYLTLPCSFAQWQMKEPRAGYSPLSWLFLHYCHFCSTFSLNIFLHVLTDLNFCYRLCIGSHQYHNIWSLLNSCFMFQQT